MGEGHGREPEFRLARRFRERETSPMKAATTSAQSLLSNPSTARMLHGIEQTH